jgi:hypothetical protein
MHLISQNYTLKMFKETHMWCTPIIPALRRLRHEDCEFKASLGYIVRLSLKQTSNKTIASWRVANLEVGTKSQYGIVHEVKGDRLWWSDGMRASPGGPRRHCWLLDVFCVAFA